MDRVVIVAGGFAGLAAARRLAGARVEVRVVDQHNFHTFQPLLYQVATAGLDSADVAYPIRTVLRRSQNVRFVHGQVSRFDLTARSVQLEDGRALSYDHLVVASGAAAAVFGVPGVREHALFLYTLDDARWVRNQVLAALERSDSASSDDSVAPVLAVVGGGPTGVETAGALSELIDIAIHHDRLPLKRQVVSDLDPTPGPASPGEARRHRAVHRDPGRPDHHARLDELSAFEPDAGRRDAEPNLHPTGAQGPLRMGARRGGEPRQQALPGVEEDDPGASGIAAHPEVFVVGDAAAICARGGAGADGRLSEQRGVPPFLPQLAQVALQSGDHAARQILCRLEGRPTAAFSYHDKGVMATIGRRSAVAELRREVVVRGTLGWIAWLVLHLVYLIGFRNRIVVLVNWAWRYLEWPSGLRLILGDVPSRPLGTVADCRGCRVGARQDP